MITKAEVWPIRHKLLLLSVAKKYNFKEWDNVNYYLKNHPWTKIDLSVEETEQAFIQLLSLFPQVDYSLLRKHPNHALYQQVYKKLHEEYTETLTQQRKDCEDIVNALKRKGEYESLKVNKNRKGEEKIDFNILNDPKYYKMVNSDIKMSANHILKDAIGNENNTSKEIFQEDTYNKQEDNSAFTPPTEYEDALETNSHISPIQEQAKLDTDIEKQTSKLEDINTSLPNEVNSPVLNKPMIHESTIKSIASPNRYNLRKGSTTPNQTSPLKNKRLLKEKANLSESPKKNKNEKGGIGEIISIPLQNGDKANEINITGTTSSEIPELNVPKEIKVAPINEININDAKKIQEENYGVQSEDIGKVTRHPDIVEMSGKTPQNLLITGSHNKAISEANNLQESSIKYGHKNNDEIEPIGEEKDEVYVTSNEEEALSDNKPMLSDDVEDINVDDSHIIPGDKAKLVDYDSSLIIESELNKSKKSTTSIKHSNKTNLTNILSHNSSSLTDKVFSKTREPKSAGFDMSQKTSPINVNKAQIKINSPIKSEDKVNNEDLNFGTSEHEIVESTNSNLTINNEFNTDEITDGYNKGKNSEIKSKDNIDIMTNELDDGLISFKKGYEQEEIEIEEKQEVHKEEEIKSELEAILEESDQNKERKNKWKGSSKKKKKYVKFSNLPIEKQGDTHTARTSTVHTPSTIADTTTELYVKDDPKKWKKLALMVLGEISNHKLAPLFQRAVKESLAPGYYDIVMEPLDLNTIGKRIKEGIITTTEEFNRDVLLMCNNALMFNREDTEIHIMTLQMLESVISNMKTLFESDLIRLN